MRRAESDFSANDTTFLVGHHLLPGLGTPEIAVPAALPMADMADIIILPRGIEWCA